MNAHNSDTSFSANHPEAGELKQGTQLTGEQAGQFAGIISSKVFQLSRKPELSAIEKTFVDRTMDLTARTIVYTADRQGLGIVDGVPARQTAAAVAKLTGTQTFPLESLPRVIEGVAGGRVEGVRDNPVHRVLAEDVAGYGMQLFGQMAESAGGVAVDEYLSSTFKSMIDGYEAVEAADRYIEGQN